jgi:hypothetical protein
MKPIPETHFDGDDETTGALQQSLGGMQLDRKIANLRDGEIVLVAVGPRTRVLPIEGDGIAPFNFRRAVNVMN